MACRGPEQVGGVHLATSLWLLWWSPKGRSAPEGQCGLTSFVSFPGAEVVGQRDLQSSCYLLWSSLGRTFSCPTIKSNPMSMQGAFPKGVCKYFMHVFHCAVVEGDGSWGELAYEQQSVASACQVVRSICLPLGQKDKQECQWE